MDKEKRITTIVLDKEADRKSDNLRRELHGYWNVVKGTYVKRVI